MKERLDTNWIQADDMLALSWPLCRISPLGLPRWRRLRVIHVKLMIPLALELAKVAGIRIGAFNWRLCRYSKCLGRR